MREPFKPGHLARNPLELGFKTGAGTCRRCQKKAWSEYAFLCYDHLEQANRHRKRKSKLKRRAERRLNLVP